MRIISQNGCDYPYESIAISYGDGIIYAGPISNMDKRYFLAKYSTPEKAEKAMEMLREAYTGAPFIMKNVEVPVGFAEQLNNMRSKGCETMATRNILHVSKLQEFEDFLETKGYMIVATSKNPYEVLRAQKDGDTVIVYQKKDAKEHLSTVDKDYHLVREFIKGKRKQSNADRIRSMSDEELAEIIICPYDTDPSVCSYKGVCLDCCLEWLKQLVED